MLTDIWAGAGHPGKFCQVITGSSDNLSRLDLKKMLACHEKGGQPVTVRVYRQADPTRSAIVTLDDHDIIIDFTEKPGWPKSGLGAGGIYIADERIFDYFPPVHERRPGSVLDLSCQVLPRLVGRMKAYVTEEFSLDIGTPGSLEKARRKWPALKRGAV